MSVRVLGMQTRDSDGRVISRYPNAELMRSTTKQLADRLEGNQSTSPTPPLPFSARSWGDLNKENAVLHEKVVALQLRLTMEQRQVAQLRHEHQLRKEIQRQQSLERKMQRKLRAYAEKDWFSV